MRNVVEYIIAAKDATSAAINTASSKIVEFGKKIGDALTGASKKHTDFAKKSSVALGNASESHKSFAASVGSNLMNIKAGFDMAFGAIKTIAGVVGSAIKEAFKFETATIQFSILMGSMSQAKDRMAELATLAAETPFNLNELMDASRQLTVFSEGAMGGTNSLRMIGDAAAATGNGVKDLSFWIGRSYSMIKGGREWGEAAMRLQEMGVLTPEVRNKMEDLQAAGASNIDVWTELETCLSRFSGGMETMSKTGDGLVSNLEDDWTAAVRTFGNAFTDASKDGISYLSEVLKDLTSDGTFASWAQTAAEWLEKVTDGAKIAGNALTTVWEYSGLSDQYHNIKGGLKGVIQGASSLAVGIADGDGIGRTLKNAGATSRDAYMGELSQGFYAKKVFGALGDPGGYLKEKETEDELDAENKKSLAAGQKSKIEDQKKKKDDEREKLKSDMAKAQKVKDDKDAVEKENKAWDDYEKEYAKWYEQETKRVEAEEKARLDMEQRLSDERAKLAEKATQEEFDGRLKGVQDELKFQEQEQSAMQNRLATAQAQVQKAWGWYRDKDSMKKQMDEEKNQAKAEVQFEKDLDRLSRRKGDWRTAKGLSVDDEATRRLGVAKEEERNAQKALTQIEENTRDLSKKLDELLTMKGGG